MKRLFIGFLTLFLLYFHTGHNSVMAFSISQINKNAPSCHQVHNPVETHKCCFITDNHTENTPSNVITHTIEKVKKQTFAIITQHSYDFGDTQKYVSFNPNCPPEPSQTNFYTSLTGIIKQLK